MSQGEEVAEKTSWRKGCWTGILKQEEEASLWIGKKGVLGREVDMNKAKKRETM